MKYSEKKLLNDTNLYIGKKHFAEFKELLEKRFSESIIFVLVDENTKKYCLPELKQNIPNLNQSIIIEVKSGELVKNLETCKTIWTQLINHSANRNSLLLNLGGGVISDIGGFCASTFKRGINYINIPTTLLAQIDASFGGKTGIDFGVIKNQIGTFSNPAGVFVFPEFLKTLSKEHLKAGYAELLKHALIADEKHWFELKEKPFDQISEWESLIAHSIGIKTKIITEDPLEKGNRKSLNFGHTIGHAIESFSLENDETPLLHGEAVAVGLICESYIAQQIFGFSIKYLSEITSYINSNFRHYEIDSSVYEKLISLMLHDKKNENDEINFTLISEPGKFRINNNVDNKLICQSLNYYQNSI